MKEYSTFSGDLELEPYNTLVSCPGHLFWGLGLTILQGIQSEYSEPCQQGIDYFVPIFESGVPFHCHYSQVHSDPVW